jgi:release factor glutamine methyltransferase
VIPLQNSGEAVKWASSFLHENRMKATQREQSDDELTRGIRYEVESLFGWATGWSRIKILTSPADPLPPDAALRFRAAVEQRATGYPLQYIMGAADFYGRSFIVRPGCLIPRPETEVLAEAAIAWIQRYQPDASVMDIGTGSGILAVTIALEAPKAQVAAVDVSADALNIARENAAKNGADVGFVHGDGVEWLKSGLLPNGSRMNVVVSNPPYIPTGEVGGLDSEVRDWEPHLALDGGETGLDIYRRISAVGDGAFAPGRAALFLEVGAGQAETVKALFANAQARLWQKWAFDIIPDLRGIGRVVWGERRA